MIGILLDEVLDKYLYNPYVVAAMLIIYGVIFIAFENRNQHAEFRIKKVSQISYQTAFYIGLFQLLALIPGTSRSGATILGAMMLGCSRTAASEFTFFLGIPVMFGASLFKDPSLRPGILRNGALLHGSCHGDRLRRFHVLDPVLTRICQKHDFKFFGYYRIVLGVIVLIYFGLTAILTK